MGTQIRLYNVKGCKIRRDDWQVYQNITLDNNSADLPTASRVNKKKKPVIQIFTA